MARRLIGAAERLLWVLVAAAALAVPCIARWLSSGWEGIHAANQGTSVEAPTA